MLLNRFKNSEITSLQQIIILCNICDDNVFKYMYINQKIINFSIFLSLFMVQSIKIILRECKYTYHEEHVNWLQPTF